MQRHANARLGPAARLDLVTRIELGSTPRAAAAALDVAPATAHRWWHRYRSASASERASGAWREDRSSRPRHSPRRTPASDEAAICGARRRSGWGPRLIAGETGHPHATVSRVLARHGLWRRERAPREPARRYEWPCPGDLLHMDTKRSARCARPGHARTGVREKTAAEKRARWGHEFAHTVVDDHSRLAYSELHPDERAATVTAFFTRALAFFAGHGMEVRRVRTDNAWAYLHNRSLAALLAEREIRHLRTVPHRPQTNGKVERFHQTMARAWAYGMTYASHHARDAALPHWLAHDNEARPHRALGGRSPISRVHNVSGQDS